MATAEQLKAILRSHVEGDAEQFLTVAMQVAAEAARKGQVRLARDLRDLIDEARRQGAARLEPAVPMARPSGELADLLRASYPKTRLTHMTLASDARAALDRVVKEYRQQDKLRSHGLSARRKLLLVGPPGSGKTMTASALAGELNLPLFAVRLDALITKFLGETAAKLRQVFEAMSRGRGVYLFDEFDAIGGDRTRPNELGEMRRVLNSLLTMIEEDDSDSLLVAATNHREALDPALFRRFDDVIRYGLPDAEQAEVLLQGRLNVFDVTAVDWPGVRRAAAGLSHADLARAADEAAKSAVLGDFKNVSHDLLVDALLERAAIATRE